jgi:PGF-pre-PGF domain-containing protein
MQIKSIGSMNIHITIFFIITCGVSLAEPVNLEFVGSYDPGRSATDVAVADDYAYISTWDGLFIVNITNPASPVFVGRYTTYGINDVAVAGDYAYVAYENYYSKGLGIVDVSDPASPTWAGRYTTGNSAYDVAVAGDYAYISTWDGLFIVNISNPTSPIFMGRYTTHGINDVAVAGDYAYVVYEDYYSNGLDIVNVSDPASPTWAGRYTTDNSAYDVAVAGDYAYISTWDGLFIVNITNPASPIFVGRYTTYGINDVAVAGDYAYVVYENDYSNGLDIVNVSDPASPTWAGRYTTNNSAYEVAVADDYAYLIDGSDGLVILRVDTGEQDTTPPASVTNLRETDIGQSYIEWSWINPTDTDFSHVMVYIDDEFVTTTSEDYYAATELTEDITYTISIKTVDTSGNINSTWVEDSATTAVSEDTTPPASVTNLRESDIGQNYIEWSWTNPTGPDFSHVMVYIDGVFVTTTPEDYYAATELTEGTTYTISIKTVDTSGNINSAWVKDSATTAVSEDTTPPASATNLRETDVGQNYIEWNWINPADPDFNYVMVYIDNAFVTTTSEEYYASTGLTEGITYTISIKTVDTSGNINSISVKDSATTTVSEDTTPPASVTNLRETDIGQNYIEWSWINPKDADFNHVMVYIDDILVTTASEEYYASTGLTEGTTYTISIKTVDTSGNINSTWVKDLATTVKLPNISNLSGTNITKNSITLIWEASSDISRVEIYRDDLSLGNVTGAAMYVDGNLSSGTTYSYILIPYTVNGLEGKAVSISLKTTSPSSGGGGGGGSSTSKSGGGGGGAGSAEDFANVALKDVDSQYLRMNASVIYEFSREGNPIQSVRFNSLKNSGEITSTIEVLKGKSKLVNSTPEGVIYKYVNIWVGKAGFATAANIKDAQVTFKVNSSWIQQMGLSPENIKLQRYNGTSWEVLPTTMENNTTGFVVFETQTPGFSPFAITAGKALASSADSDTDTQPDDAAVAGTEQAQPGKNGIWKFILALFVVESFALGFDYWRKRRK